ncbi:MAG: hypothetical protein J6I87_07035 [Rikenellaceae bacterium]|nr:hypothetical protein [Rikenellaceae bacterium]
MKKFFYLVAAVAMLFTACEFDPTDLNNRIDDLENRVTELEETIAALNQDIAGVETLVNAMQNNVYVSKIVKGEKAMRSISPMARRSKSLTVRPVRLVRTV